jgi:hypothetical protein
MHQSYIYRSKEKTTARIHLKLLAIKNFQKNVRAAKEKIKLFHILYG